jgi:hypothetical protein
MNREDVYSYFNMLKVVLKQDSQLNRSQVKVFCVVTPCSVAVRYQHFDRLRCLHRQGEDLDLNFHRSENLKSGIFSVDESGIRLIN